MLSTGPDMQFRTINIQAPRYNFEISKGKGIAKKAKSLGTQ